MYVVNYGNGWDILSNDEHSRLVLFTSNKGSIDLSDSTTYSASLKSYIDATAEELIELKRESKESDIPVNQEWSSFQPVLSSVPENTISITDRAASQNNTRNIPGPGEDGEWVLIQVQSETTGNRVDHLSQTKWNQDYPWNAYCRDISDGQFYGNFYLAGCAAVAVGQYLYYYHFLDNNPIYTITDVVLSGDNISFTGQSSSRWNQMALTSTDSVIRKDYVARYLRYLGDKMYSDYGNQVTLTIADNILDYLASIGYVLEQNAFDFNYVKSALDDNQIVLSGACRYPDGRDGHLFIIDGYQDQITTKTFIYGWNGSDQNGNETVDVGGDPNDISSYTYISTIVNTTTSNYVFMNWGYGGSGDNIGCSPSIADDWTGHYNFYRTIFN